MESVLASKVVELGRRRWVLGYKVLERGSRQEVLGCIVLVLGSRGQAGLVSWENRQFWEEGFLLI